MSVARTPPGPPAPATAATATVAIRKAAQATGANFNYLLATARVESGLDPKVAARTSSATGLFQFIDQTWLATVKQAGATLGYGQEASAIARTPSGRYVVPDQSQRSDVMALRKDPTANAAMAGAFTRSNATSLEHQLGRAPSESELYIAHFLGAGDAAKLIGLAGVEPQAAAAARFPQAARANRPIFYDRTGAARSVAAVTAELRHRYQAARAAPVPVMAPASASTQTAPAPTVLAAHTVAAARVNTPAVAAAMPTIASAGETPVLASDAPRRPMSAKAAVDRPVFHSLFRSDGLPEPIAPLVTALWSAPAAPVTNLNAPTAASSKAQGASATPVLSGDRRLVGSSANGKTAHGPLHDLFQDARPNARALFDGKV